jgi:putative ABC transport system permease protein
VLLIACANIANLFLARAAARRHEFSLRLALGASRWRLARQQLVESLVLSGAGALAGLAMARWATDLLVRQLSTQANTVFLDTHLDWRAVAFTAAVTIAVSLLFGVVPAVRASAAESMEAMREHGRHMTQRARRGLGGLTGPGVLDSVVVGQVALSLVLVVGAGLFIRTFTTLATRDLGFDPDPVLLVRLDARGTGVAPAGRAALYERVADAVRATTGVAQASISDVTPVSGMILDGYVEVENGPRLMPPQNVSYKNTVTPGWFATCGTHFVAGRDFDDRDRLASPPLVIVNETFARRFLPGGNPVGRRIRNPSPAPGEQRGWMEVVAVVADATYLSLRDAVPATQYVPLAQQDGSGPFSSLVSLSIRTTGRAPSLLARSVAEAIALVDPNIAITFTPLKQQVDAALVQERIVAILSGFFGALALLLAGLGLYGVTAYAVTRRRTEIGIRMALGAQPGSVVRFVLGRVALTIAAGIVIGAGLSAWAAQFVASLLYGLEPRDPMTLAGAALTLSVVGATAGWVPARRAARIDPAAVLRDS